MAQGNQMNRTLSDLIRTLVIGEKDKTDAVVGRGAMNGNWAVDRGGAVVKGWVAIEDKNKNSMSGGASVGDAPADASAYFRKSEIRPAV